MTMQPDRLDVDGALPADMPAALRVGHTVFMGVTLRTMHGVLAPRAETEALGYTALAALALHGTEPVVIDMCCGAGNLACALAVHAPGATIWASDLTDACVQASRANVQSLGLQERITVVQGDLFVSLDGAGLHGRVDMVVCNPPYISQGKLAGDKAALLQHEPREAFDGGAYGISIHQRVIRDALPFLRPGGTLVFEVGEGQDRQVASLFRRAKAYGDITVHAPDGQAGRVVSGRKIDVE